MPEDRWRASSDLPGSPRPGPSQPCRWLLLWGTGARTQRETHPSGTICADESLPGFLRSLTWLLKKKGTHHLPLITGEQRRQVSVPAGLWPD